MSFLIVALLLSEDEYDEKCVSVLLEGEEAEIVFIDHPSAEISVRNSVSALTTSLPIVTFEEFDKTSMAVFIKGAT